MNQTWAANHTDSSLDTFKENVDSFTFVIDKNKITGNLIYKHKMQ